jgi:fibro-slime domain-containing protein
MRSTFVFLSLAVALIGCGTNDPGTLGGGGNGAAGNGGGGVNIKLDASPNGGGGNAGQSGTALPPGSLNMVVRDFKFYDANDAKTNPDFENVPKTDQNGQTCNPQCYGPWPDLDIVTDTLGSDFKPVYKNTSGNTLTTHGQAAFDQWYNTVDGTNLMQQIPLALTKNANGTYSYDSQSAGPPLSPNGGFFPIDDSGPYKTAFGNQGQDGNNVSHNFSFTVEIHTVFTYNGGETFDFRGDDDVFVYIDNKRVINLGGIHGAQAANVNVDTLGLTKGKSYALDFFYAERHVVQSNMLITTTLDLSNNGDIPIF